MKKRKLRDVVIGSKNKKHSEKHECEVCKEPTELRGWYFISTSKDFSFDKMRKRYYWLCEKHFLINMFNLWPFVCTCKNLISKRTGSKAENEPVWIEMTTVLTPAYKPEPNKSVPMKLIDVKCPHCGKKMKLLKMKFR